MVIMSSNIQAGWDFDNDDNIIDNTSLGSTSSFKRGEIPKKNEGESDLGNFVMKTAHNKTHTDEEGWTTTRPGKKKPKKQNNKGSSIESIITTVDGNIDKIEAGTQNRIYVMSPGRKHKCNVPEERNEMKEHKSNVMMANGIEKGKEQSKEGTREEEKEGSDKSDKNRNNNIDKGNGERKEGEEENKEGNNKSNGNEGNKRGGRDGKGGRGGRGGRTERKQIPKKEWETYGYSISFNPKTMVNKDPDAEFQAVLSQIMKKSPGVVFYPTNVLEVNTSSRVVS